MEKIIIKNEDMFFVDAEDVNNSYTENVDIEALEEELEEESPVRVEQKRDIVFESLYKANIPRDETETTSVRVTSGDSVAIEPNVNAIIEDQVLIDGPESSIQVKANDCEEAIKKALDPDEVKRLFPDLPPPKPGKKYRILVIKRRPYKCTECLHSTTSEERLQRHVKKVHRQEPTFKCPMCEYSTSHKNVFEVHLRIHGGIKPYACSFCYFASASPRNLIKHQMIHREDNPLLCSKCPFIAKHMAALSKHESSHEEFDMMFEKNPRKKRTKKMPRSKPYFICAVCSWTGNCRNKVLLHLLHHPEQDVPDNLDVSILQKYGIMFRDRTEEEVKDCEETVEQIETWSE